MKSLKQSRLDRILRKRLRAEKLKLAEKKITKSERIKRDNAFLKKIAKQCWEEGNKRCLHGITFSGYECFSCNADDIATRLRDEWSPIPTYKATVIDDDPTGSIPVTIKTRNITKKIVEMQENGFWYNWKGSAIFMLPGKMKVVILEEMVQNLGYNDPPVKPSTTTPENRKSAQG